MSTIRVKIVKTNGGKKKKIVFFLIVFLTYLFIGSPKFQVWKLVGSGIQFCIQPIPTLHTSKLPTTPKNENFNKKKVSFLGIVATSEVCSVGMGWMQNSI